MRYLRASLAAGLVYCTLAPALVHFVLPADIVGAFVKVFSRIEGTPPPAADAPTNWFHVALVFAMRLAFGFVTMGLYAWARRSLPRLQAGYRAGVWTFTVTYVPLLAWFHFGHELPLPLVMFGVAIGMVETMVAAMVGCWAAGPE